MIDATYRTYQTYAHERNFGCRIREFVYRGHRCISLENELLRIVIAVDKGTDILEFVYKPIDIDFLWHSYNGLRPIDNYLPSNPLAEGHFRDYYPGGWHEMLPNGARHCNYRGAPFGLHGEITLLPWDCYIEVDEPEIVVVRFRVRTTRLPLLVEKKLTLHSGSATLLISERVVSEAGQPIEILWGQHPTFGWPFLESGCKVVLPDCWICTGNDLLANSRVAPAQRARWPFVQGREGETLDLSVIPGPDAKSQDFFRLEDLSAGWYAIVNARKKVGFALCWDLSVFPTLGFWQVFRGGLDYPWYGMNYLAALEPACDLPSLTEAAQKGAALRLRPGEALETYFEATAFREPLEVSKVGRGGIVE